MRLVEGERIEGPAGTATEVLIRGRLPRPDWLASVSTWFLDCPGQSPAWRHYRLSAIHLRPIDRVPPADIRVPGSTHEFLLAALDPQYEPTPTHMRRWHMLRPLNMVEQVALPDDEAAARVCRLAAKAVVDGVLPAEPPLSGAVEPWRTALLRTAAHERGEEHAP